MRYAHSFGVVALGFVVSASSLHGEGRAGYRDFKLGGDVRSVSAITGVGASDVKTIHMRPALMQELEWRRGYSTAEQSDPVQQIVFSFYQDQLSKLVVDYDRERTDGMTDDDMIEALSAAYGSPATPAVKASRATASRVEVESGTPVARWGGRDFSVVLYRASYRSAFRIIVTSTQLEALARKADAQASRLDEQEAPQRESARQKKEAADTRLVQEKVRLANKAAFRP